MRIVLLLGVAVVASVAGPFLHATDHARSSRMVVVRANEGKSFFPGHWKLTTNQTNGAYALVEVNDTTTREIQPHKHTREDEAWYVFEGELTFEVGDERAVAGPGTLVYAPRDVPHFFKVSRAPARYLMIFSPAGLEGFFEEIDRLRADTEQDDPEFERKRDAIRAKYGIVPIKELQPEKQ